MSATPTFHSDNRERDQTLRELDKAIKAAALLRIWGEGQQWSNRPKALRTAHRKQLAEALADVTRLRALL